MNGYEHERAIELISRREVEGIAEAEAHWLETHLAACEDCAQYEFALSGAEQAMRSFTVMASASLIASTQARVHARAEQLRERESRLFLIGISFCLGTALSALTAWVWWKVGGWVVERLSLPASIVGPGIVFFWLLPALCLGVVLMVFPHSEFEGSVMQLLMKEHQRGIE